MRLGIAAYVVPFVFALHPSLILKGSYGENLLAVGAATTGTFLLAIGCVGYLFRPLTWIRRAAFWFSGLLLMLPTWHGAWLLADVSGLILGIALIVLERSGSTGREATLVQGKATSPESSKLE
jgi:TRAP-type uncharacterized transport system fused permease subunit